MQILLCIDDPDCSQAVVPKHVSQNSEFVDDLNEEERQVADVVGGINVEESGAMTYRELVVVGGTNVEEMTPLTVREVTGVLGSMNVGESGAITDREVADMQNDSELEGTENATATDDAAVEHDGSKVASEVNGETAGVGIFSRRSPGSSNLSKKQAQKQEAVWGRHLDKETNKFVEVNKIERTLGPRCSCKASYYLCKQVSDNDREKIHNSIWSIAWDEKEVFVRTSVDVKDVKERKGVSVDHKRNNTLVFTLKGAGERKRVCKEMFLSTTGLKKWWVLNTVRGEEKRKEVPEQKKKLLMA